MDSILGSSDWLIQTKKCRGDTVEFEIGFSRNNE